LSPAGIDGFLPAPELGRPARPAFVYLLRFASLAQFLAESSPQLKNRALRSNN
jgi:hypothetical protein